MDTSTNPFPLAANSSHHSHYHRFLLGVDPVTIAPFPKPCCRGALAATLGALAENLDLPRWRKLYHGAFPWVPGFGPRHFDLGNVPAHRPLPRDYCRPPRRFAAFDFVQVADPAVSALALVAGDRRVLERFVALSDDFGAQVETGIFARAKGPAGSRFTGRMLAGQFAEPNNRWLMPFLHVHTRVLNFTSFEQAPGRLECLDSEALARAGQRARRGWVDRQAEALSELGYRASVRGDTAPALTVEGVGARLIAVMEAPRIAVARLLERMIAGDRPASAERLCAELPPAVIAAMAEQLEHLLAHSLASFKPPKVAVPSEGPWRLAVREHLGLHCPGSLAELDAAASRAKAVIFDSAVFPTPAQDAAHCHAPRMESLEAAAQLPADPELAADRTDGVEGTAPAWLIREFEATLSEVNARIVRAGPDDPLVSLRSLFATIDNLAEGAGTEQLRQSRLFIGVELERGARSRSIEVYHHSPRGAGGRPSVASLDELFEAAAFPRPAREREIGGRSL